MVNETQPNQITIGVLKTHGATVKVLRNGHEVTLHEGDAICLYDILLTTNVSHTAFLLMNGNVLVMPDDKEIFLDEPAFIHANLADSHVESWDAQDELLDDNKQDEHDHVAMQKELLRDHAELILPAPLATEIEAGVFETQYGYMTIDAHGRVSYRLDPTNSSVQNFAPGVAVTDHLPAGHPLTSVAPSINLTPHAPITPASHVDSTAPTPSNPTAGVSSTANIAPHAPVTPANHSGSTAPTPSTPNAPVITPDVTTPPTHLHTALPNTVNTNTMSFVITLGPAGTGSTQATGPMTIDITDGGNLDNVINAQESHGAKPTGTIDPTAKLQTLEVTDSTGKSVAVDPSHVTIDPGTFHIQTISPMDMTVSS